MSDYKPGDVVRLRDGTYAPHARILFRTEAGWVDAEGDRRYGSLSESRHASPLAVIDPEDREAAERLCDLIPWLGAAPNLVDDIQQALREFAAPKPPKPAEPLGDGAVVEDSEGRRWTRIAAEGYIAAGAPRENLSAPWRRRGMNGRWWDHLNVVRVLSEGVRDE